MQHLHHNSANVLFIGGGRKNRESNSAKVSEVGITTPHCITEGFPLNGIERENTECQSTNVVGISESEERKEGSKGHGSSKRRYVEERRGEEIPDTIAT